MKLLIKNIKELIQVENTIKLKVCGKDMKKLGTVKDAYLFIKDGIIEDFGLMKNMPAEYSGVKSIDASGKMVFHI